MENTSLSQVPDIQDLHKTLKNIEVVLLRLESRFREKYPTWEESQVATKRFEEALKKKRQNQ